MEVRARSVARVGQLVLLVGLVCCGRPGKPLAPEVRDSLGIEIVEHPALSVDSAGEWQLSNEPILSIGAADGAEEYQLYNVVSAQLIGSARIAVAMGFSNRIRFYDLDGTYVASVGEEGGGPGEFKTIMGVWRLRADSIGVFDFGNARLTVLTDQGQLGRVNRFEQVPDRPLPLPVGPFSDGTFLGRAHMLGTEAGRPEGVHRGLVEFVRWSPTGELLDSLAVRPDAERYYGEIDGRPTMASPPFSREFSVAVSGDQWYYGSMSAYEIEVYSAQGSLIRLIRRSGSSRPVTLEMKEAWQRSARERWSQLPAAALAWRLALPFPETLPAHGDLVVDDLGNLWVAEYGLPTEPQRWAVYGPGGLLLGRVATPPDGTVTHIGADFVLGVWRDDLGVERVRMYRLIRAG
ncbi:MAG: hypothetical protein Q8N53_12375 [Longimicrobiales bacterium]|nr:hypothetical protein [Longimicrobiales bacterium]